MKRIPLTEASLDDLRAFADVQGLEYDKRFGADKMRAIIAQAWDQPDIELLEDEAASVQPVQAAKPLTQAKDRVRVIISHEENGIDPVPISHNGTAILIRRGEEVEISREHYHALTLSVQAIPVKDRDGNIVEWRKRPTFPYQVLSA